MAFQPQPIENFIGKGLTFPIELSGGRGVIKSGFEVIRSSIRMILSWPYAQRFMLGEFGSRVEEMLEEPNDEISRQLIESFIKDALDTWEKRIQVLELGVENNSTEGTVMIKLRYSIVNSQLVDNFVFPFYRQIKY